jgi:4-amino-4-deoxy-L-arabinose transferase-like glycosyltransferase
VIALLLAALALRTILLGTAPPGVRFDELVNVQMADHIYAGEWPIYFQEAWGHEPLYHYVHAAGIWILGQNVWGVRITSILFGVLGVFTTWLALRTLCGRWVALVAALLLAASFWSLMYSRIGLRHISLPPLVGICAYFFWRGLLAPREGRTPGLAWFGLGGLTLGAMLYTYFASRVVPAIFGLFVLYLAAFHRPMLRQRWPGIALFFALGALVAVPMFVYLYQHPELEQRLGQVGGDLASALRAGDLPMVARAVLDTLAMFSIEGDPEWLYNISGRPVFSPTTALFFYLGLLLSLWRWQDPRRAFLLIWLAVGVAPAMLSWPPGSLGHTIAAQPAAMALPALGLAAAREWVAGKGGGHARARELAWGATALTAAVLVLFVLHNAVDYFVRWPQFEPVRHEYQAPMTATARYLSAHPEVDSAAISAPYVDYWNPWSKMSFDLFFHDDRTQVRWFDGQQAVLLPSAQGTRLLIPDIHGSSTWLAGEFLPLLAEGAAPVETPYVDRNGATINVYHWQGSAALDQEIAIATSAPAWASAEGALPEGAAPLSRTQVSLPIPFQDRLTLLGYQYASATATPGKELKLVSYWEVASSKDAPLSIFVHVLDDENAVRAGWDGLSASSTGWQQGDILVQAHTLSLPGDIEPGTYRVEMGLYSPETLNRVSPYVRAGEAAPHDRILIAPLTVP